MLKAGKPSEASKHLQQGLEMLVGGSWLAAAAAALWQAVVCMWQAAATC
jgi:hypothetical protein